MQLADVTARANCPTINYVWLEANIIYTRGQQVVGGTLAKYLLPFAKSPVTTLCVTRKNLAKIFSHAFAGNDRPSTVRLLQYR